MSNQAKISQFFGKPNEPIKRKAKQQAQPPKPKRKQIIESSSESEVETVEAPKPKPVVQPVVKQVTDPSLFFGSGKIIQSEQVKAKNESTVWNCVACTLANNGDASACSACGLQKGQASPHKKVEFWKCNASALL